MRGRGEEDEGGREGAAGGRKMREGAAGGRKAAPLAAHGDLSDAARPNVGVCTLPKDNA